LVKLSSNGDIVWERHYGGRSADAFESLALCKDGSLVAVGYTESTDGDFPAVAGATDGVVAKVSSGGELTWAQVYGDTDRDEFNSVAVTASGGIVAVGETFVFAGEGYSGSNDAVLARYTAKGSLGD